LFIQHIDILTKHKRHYGDCLLLNRLLTHVLDRDHLLFINSSMFVIDTHVVFSMSIRTYQLHTHMLFQSINTRLLYGVSRATCESLLVLYRDCVDPIGRVKFPAQCLSHISMLS